MKIALFFCILFVQIGISQTLASKGSEPIEATSFVGFDSYNNVYFINDFALHKEGKDGMFQYTNFQLGEIASVDILNPLSVVVFYKDTNTVVLLDNKLAEIQVFNFNLLPEFVNVGAARNAGNNRLWLFNTDTQQIELYDYFNKTKVAISQPISEDIKATTSNFNTFFLSTENKVTIYNSYGGILKEISIAGFEKMVQHNDTLMGLRENELFYFSKKEASFKNLLIPEITVKDLWLRQDLLYLYDGKNVHTFSIIQPQK